MTKPRRTGHKIGRIKAALVIGSVIASIQGAQALGSGDAAEYSAASPPEPIIIRIEEDPQRLLPRSLEIVQSPVRMAPVARSRSSS